MASLNSTSAPEDLVAAEANVVTYQSAVARVRNTNWQEDQQSDVLALVEDLSNADYSNLVVPFINSIEFGSVENELLHARVGLVNEVSFAAKFYEGTDSLLANMQDDFLAWQTDLINADPTNPAPIKEVKLEESHYSDDSAKFSSKVHQYKKLELQDAINAAALTSDEQQLWNQFQSALTEKCKAACSNYRAKPTFARCPWVELDLENLDPTNSAAELEVKLEEKMAINANISVFNTISPK